MKTSGVQDGLTNPVLGHAVKAFMLVVSANHNGDFDMLNL